jgi:hypothetical protein
MKADAAIEIIKQSHSSKNDSGMHGEKINTRVLIIIKFVRKSSIDEAEHELHRRENNYYKIKRHLNGWPLSQVICNIYTDYAIQEKNKYLRHFIITNV